MYMQVIREMNAITDKLCEKGEGEREEATKRVKIQLKDGNKKERNRMNRQEQEATAHRGNISSRERVIMIKTIAS